jgi:hypothetical protein
MLVLIKITIMALFATPPGSFHRIRNKKPGRLALIFVLFFTTPMRSITHAEIEWIFRAIRTAGRPFLEL